MGASPLRNSDRQQAPGAEVSPSRTHWTGAVSVVRDCFHGRRTWCRIGRACPSASGSPLWVPTTTILVRVLVRRGGRGCSRASTRPAARYGSRRARLRRVGLAAPPARHKAAGATTLESPRGGKAVLAPVPAGVCQWRPRPNASRLISRAINRIWCPSCGPRHAARRNIWPRAARSRRALSTPQRQSTAAPDRAEAQRGRRTSCAFDCQNPRGVAINV